MCRLYAISYTVAGWLTQLHIYVKSLHADKSTEVKRKVNLTSKIT